MEEIIQPNYYENKQSRRQPLKHMFVLRGGKTMDASFSSPTPEVLKEIKGKEGKITVLKNDRKITALDDDIHSLLARVLIMKETRTKATGE